MSRLGFSDREPKSRSTPSWAQPRERASSGEVEMSPPDAPELEGSLRTLAPESSGDLSVGVRVLHPSFGLGTIQRRDGSPENLKLRIDFDRQGRKTVFARYAQLVLVIS